MIFQEESTFPWRTVIDNVTFPLEIAAMGKAERLDKARHFVSLVGLEGFERRYPSKLSGGMLGVAAGMRQIDKVLIRVGRSFRCGTWQMVTKIYLPAMRELT